MVNGSAKPSATAEKCYIYIIGTSTGAYKVGIANNPEKRHQNLKSGIPDPSRLLLKIEVTNRAIALYVEREIHRILKQYHSQGEWFKPPKSVLGELLLELGEKIEVLRPEAPLIQYQNPVAKFEDCAEISLEDDTQESVPGVQDQTSPNITAPGAQISTPSEPKSPFEPAHELKQICMNCRHWAPDPEHNYEKGLCALMPLGTSRVLLIFGPLAGDSPCVLAESSQETEVYWRRITEGRDLHTFECFKEIETETEEADH